MRGVRSEPLGLPPLLLFPAPPLIFVIQLHVVYLIISLLKMLGFTVDGENRSRSLSVSLLAVLIQPTPQLDLIARLIARAGQ